MLVLLDPTGRGTQSQSPSRARSLTPVSGPASAPQHGEKGLFGLSVQRIMLLPWTEYGGYGWSPVGREWKSESENGSLNAGIDNGEIKHVDLEFIFTSRGPRTFTL
jgi:hypothetical protein